MTIAARPRMVSAKFTTRCGCSRFTAVQYPPPIEYALPLSPPLEVENEGAPTQVPVVRRFVLQGSWSADTADYIEQ